MFLLYHTYPLLCQFRAILFGMSEKHKKILFVITKSNWGGAQRYVFDLATSLSATYDVAVALGGNGKLKEILENNHVRTISLTHLTNTISLGDEIRSSKELYRLFRTERADILHLNSSKAGAIGALAGRLARVPHIVFTAHAWAWNEDRPFLARAGIALIHWLTVILSHRTITVSHSVNDQMARFPFTKRKMRVIHPGIIPLPRVDRAQARALFATQFPTLRDATGPWLVTLAELHPIKGHRYALTTFLELRKTHPTAVYVLIGDGSERDALSDFVKKENLTDAVFFAGHIQDAATLLSAFDIFVLSSLSESFGYVLLEAGGAEVPVIASDVGGIPEIISEGAGILVPPKNEILLLDALLHTLSHTKENTTRIRALKERVATYFTKERMVEETRDLYDSLTEPS